MKVKDIAALFGYTGQWVKNRYDDGTIPKPVGGEIDLEEAASGIVKYLKRQLDLARGATQKAAEARAGVQEEDRLLKQQKRMKLAGELVELKLVENVWSARKAACRQVIEQSKLDKKEREEVLQELEATGVEEFLIKGL